MVVKIMVPVLGTLNNRSRIIIGTQKGTIILTTTHFALRYRAGDFQFLGAPKFGPCGQLLCVCVCFFGALEYHTLILFCLKEPLWNKSVYFFLPGYLKAQGGGL